jgi:hypothetical protein
MYSTAREELVAGFRNDRMLAAKDGKGGAFDFVVFGGNTTNGKPLASYFMPYCQNCLSVTEEVGTTADLLSQNFNVTTVDRDFASTVSFKARQSVIGLGLHYLQSFWYNDDNSKFWYIDTSTSVQNVNNRMRMREVVTTDGGGADTALNPNAVSNMTEAFNQSAWCFGKINSCSHKKTGLADIEFKVGYQWHWTESCHGASYVGLLIPTGNKAKGRYVFEPIIGWGKHWGLMFGSEFGIDIWESCNEKWTLSLEWYTHSLYLFSNKQIRSFDLKEKPWSRYQEVYANLDQAQAAFNLPVDDPTRPFLSTPGINVFTRCVNVTPGYRFDLNTDLVIKRECGFQASVGWDVYARQAECVKLKWTPGPAIKADIGAGETNPVRNITPNALLNADNVAFSVANFEATEIQKGDIDVNSAATPAGVSYTFQGSLGYVWDNRCYPMDVNFGGSYEFGNKDNAMPNRWTAWGKIGVAF